MAAIKVHGTPFSTAAARALVTLHEKELNYEFVPINMGAGEHKQEPFISLNPFGQVPAFEDGDLQLFESRAISKYLAYTYTKEGTELIFQDTKKMASVFVWMEVEAHQFDPAASKLVWELCIKSLFGMTTDEAVVEENEGKLGKVLDIYETRLTQSKYLGGDSFTLADLHHLPVIQYLMGTRSKAVFDSRPHVSTWCSDILGRPSWEKVLAMQKQ